MSRPINSLTAEALADPVIYAINFVEMAFPGGFLRLHTGVGTISFGGQDYTGAGNLGQISEIEETTELRAVGINLSLSGVPSELLSKVLTENIRNKNIKIWFCLCNSNFQIIGDSILIFDGTMDTLAISDQGGTSTIQVTAESRIIDLSRPRTQVYTDEFQRTIYATDKSHEYLADLANKANGFKWG